MAKVIDSICFVEVGDTYLNNSREDLVVRPKCDVTDTRAGHWVCATHRQGFADNLEMWNHTDLGNGPAWSHAIGWHCNVHDAIEVP
jgi:hypothetical protein